MNQFKRHQIESPVIGVVDVGSYKIRVSICRFGKEKVELLGYGEKRQSFHDIVSGEIHHIKGLTDNIKIAVEKAEQEAKTTIDTIVVNCFVGIPSLFSYKINHIRKHPDAPIDLEELDTIISETQYNGLQSSLQQLESHLGITKQDIEVCVSDISGIHIDGKSYHNPLKHQGKNIKFDITQIFAKRTDILTINTIGNIIGKNIIKIIPENYAISKLWEPEEGMVVINIGNTHSYITVKTSPHYTLGSITIESGIHDLVKIIQETSKKGKSEIIAEIGEDGIYEEEKQKFLALFGEMVLLGLKEIIGDDICPHTFFIIGGGGNNVFIETFFLSHIRSGKLSGVRFIKDAQIYTPEVKKISTIIGIEDILSKSNINMVAMIISMHTILQRQHDAVEISLQKAIKKLEMS